MKFKALPVTSFEDATLDLEQLSTLDILNLTAESVLQLAVTGTVRKIAVGTQAVVWPNSVTATPVNVTHGLGKSPACVMLTQAQASGAGQVTSYQCSAVSSTVFTIQGQANVAVNATVSVFWLAFG